MGKTVAFIPVRGGSSSIPLKNIKPLCGKPLLYWVAAAANACNSIDEVVISTDSPVIAETANALQLDKVKVVDRGADTATDTATTESAMLEYAKANDFEVMVLVQATSPLLTNLDLDNGFELFNRVEVDSVLSVVEDKRFYWQLKDGNNAANMIAEPINYDVFSRPRRQDFDGCFMENGAFYISRRQDILSSHNRVSGRIALSVMPPDTAFEIDEPEDWRIIEELMRKRDARLISGEDGFQGVKMLLTDCDGCLTDAGMYYSENGEELKKFNTRDGMAFSQLHDAGILTGIITGESSQAVLRRAKKVSADYVEIGCDDKLTAVEAICSKEEIGLQEVAYIGDDANDLELLKAVGFPCCPLDAQEPAIGIAKYISSRRGGMGVFRDVADKILESRGKFARV